MLIAMSGTEKCDGDDASYVIISVRAEGSLMRKRETRKAMTKSEFNRFIADGETVEVK